MTLSNKIKIIIAREYLTRVRKKSFIIMTIIGPVLMAAIVILPVWLTTREGDTHQIEVVDETGIFNNEIPDSRTLKFHFSSRTLAEAKKTFYAERFTAILYIPPTVNRNIAALQLFYKKQPGIPAQAYITRAIEKKIESEKLLASGINEAVLKSIKTRIRIVTAKLEESGREEKSSSELSAIVGFGGGILIYIFMFLYGTLVMRGVMEEKTNRIIEVIVSSVKPFQLMMGKVIGVALVGLTQFALWVAITFVLVAGFQSIYVAKKFDPSQFLKEKGQATISPAQLGLDEKMTEPEAADNASEIFAALDSINFPVIIAMFIFYFLGGYLLYSAFFAAIGSAVDSETDTQQFIFPITIPLILAFVMAQFVINNPDGPVAFWFSMIPLTSPIIMMVRIPFGVPYWELALSAALLILGFVAAIWLAAKIYRVGILMYGKKVTYGELWKWIRYT